MDELLDQLADVVGEHGGREVRRGSKAEVDVGATHLQPASVRDALSRQELNVLIPGFRTIRDQEPLDDVADWANAVVALLEDEAGRNPAD